jgi:hypothetical protein
MRPHITANAPGMRHHYKLFARSIHMNNSAIWRDVAGVGARLQLKIASRGLVFPDTAGLQGRWVTVVVSVRRFRSVQHGAFGTVNL